MIKKPHALTVTDYRGETVIFTREKLDEKRLNHPELYKKTFIDCVKRALIDPDQVWEDHKDRQGRRCYYKKYSTVSYAKVVVLISVHPNIALTAYQIDHIKEEKYPDLKRLK